MLIPYLIDKILIILYLEKLYKMFFNRFDSYYYSRPIAYRSYNTRLTKPELLRFDDSETQEVMNYLRN